MQSHVTADIINIREDPCFPPFHFKLRCQTKGHLDLKHGDQVYFDVCAVIDVNRDFKFKSCLAANTGTVKMLKAQSDQEGSFFISHFDLTALGQFTNLFQRNLASVFPLEFDLAQSLSEFGIGNLGIVHHDQICDIIAGFL